MDSPSIQLDQSTTGDNYCYKYQKAQKLSKSTKFLNSRFLVLYKNRFCYFNNPPKEVNTNNEHDAFIYDKIKAQPKYTVPIKSIKYVGKIKAEITKKYKKLKQFNNSTMEITFNLGDRFTKKQKNQLNRSLTPDLNLSRGEGFKSQTPRKLNTELPQQFPTLSRVQNNLQIQIEDEKVNDNVQENQRSPSPKKGKDKDKDKKKKKNQSPSPQPVVPKKLQKEVTWYFSFEKPKSCVGWIKKIQFAIDCIKNPALARLGTTGAIDLDDSAQINDRLNQDQPGQFDLDTQLLNNQNSPKGPDRPAISPRFQQPMKMPQVKQSNTNSQNIQPSNQHNISYFDDESDEEQGRNQHGTQNAYDQQEINLMISNAQEYFEKKDQKQKRSWDLKFQNLWGNLIEQTQKFEENMAQTQKFMHHIGAFRQHAENLFMHIVDQMHLPMSERTFTPAEDIPSSAGVFCEGENNYQNVYLEDHMILKVTHNDTNEKLEFKADQDINFRAPRQRFQISGNQGSGYFGNDQNITQQNENKVQSSLWKKYGRQFFSLDILFDSLFLLSRKSQKGDGQRGRQRVQHLRVPLTCLIDYKGYRAIAYAKLSIEPQLGVIVGVNKGRYQMNQAEITRTLRYAGELLNLKPVRTGQAGIETVPISMSIEVYDRKSGDGSDDENEYYQGYGTNPSGGRQNPGVGDSLNIIDRGIGGTGSGVAGTHGAGIYGGSGTIGQGGIPRGLGNDGLGGGDGTSEKQQHKLHFMGLDYRQSSNDMFYVVKTSQILPHDLQSIDILDTYLRPEFLAGYQKALCSDSSRPKQQDSMDRFEVKQASRDLKNTIIPQLISLFDSLTIVPIDSQSLTQAFHQQGVNMRYLGVVATQASLHHVKTICMVQMLARTVKLLVFHNFNCQIQQVYVNDQRSRVATRLPAKDQINMDAQLKNWLKQYLNDLFSNNTERSNYEWAEVFQQAQQKFHYNFPHNFQVKQHFNALYYAIQYHLNFIILTKNKPGALNQQSGPNILKGGSRGTLNFIGKIQHPNLNQSNNSPRNYMTYFGGGGKTPLYELKQKVELGKVERPFEQQWEIHFRPKSKIFKLRNVPYIILANQYNEFRQQYRNERALKSCALRLQATKLLYSKTDADILVEIAQILLEQGLIDEALEKATTALRQMESSEHSARAVKIYILLLRAYFSFNSVTSGNEQFTLAVNALGNHWGPDHPSLIILYSVVAFLFIQHKDDQAYQKAQALYKTAQNCCSRVLGANHIQTAEVYMDFGSLEMLNGRKSQALNHIQKAYSIYDSYFGKEALPTANAAFQLAGLLQDQGNVKGAVHYAIIASDIFTQIYGDAHEISIHALWLVVSVLFTMREHQRVYLFVDKLFKALVRYERLQRKKRVGIVAGLGLNFDENQSPRREEGKFQQDDPRGFATQSKYPKNQSGAIKGRGNKGDENTRNVDPNDEMVNPQGKDLMLGGVIRAGQRGGMSFRSPASMLYYSIAGRQSDGNSIQQEMGMQDDLTMYMNNMTQNCVIAVVLNSLITMNDSDKRTLSRYLQALLADEGGQYINYVSKLKKGVSSMGKINIRNIQIDQEGKMLMHDMYNSAKLHSGGITEYFHLKVREFMKIYGRKMEETAASGGTREIGGGAHNEGDLGDLERIDDEATMFQKLVLALESLIFSTLLPENKEILDSQ